MAEPPNIAAIYGVEDRALPVPRVQLKLRATISRQKRAAVQIALPTLGR
jgi:hypothetical protein